MSKFVQRSERSLELPLGCKDPEKWKWGAPMGWQYSDIFDYLAAGMQYFARREERFVKAQPTWRDLTEFLYYGKIYE